MGHSDDTQSSVVRVGAGRPVVMVHGSGGGSHSWRPVADLLAREGFEVWLPVRRGYAPNIAVTPTRTAVRTSTFQQESDDLLAIVDRLAEPPHLVGASFGALVALQFARRHPRSLASVALWEPPLFAVGPHIATVRGRYAALVTAGQRAQADVVLMREVAMVPEAMVGAAEAMAEADQQPDQRPDDETSAETAGWMSDLEALSLADPDPPSWAVSGVPALLLQGSDTWEPMPTALDRLAERMPGLRRTTIEGQQHFAPSLVPQRVAGELQRFWGSLV